MESKPCQGQFLYPILVHCRKIQVAKGATSKHYLNLAQNALVILGFNYLWLMNCAQNLLSTDISLGYLQIFYKAKRP